MKKALKVLVIVLVVLIAIVWIAVVVAGGKTIELAVNQGGPAILNVPVTLEEAEFRPLRGLVRLQGLHIGNPEGFKSDGLFDLYGMRIKLDPASLLTDTIHIEAIQIDEPHITYELALGQSNIGALLKHLEGDTEEEAEDTEEPAEKKDEKPGKKVIIDKIVIAGARVKVASTLTAGVGASIPLGTITVTDIGKEKGGTTFAEAVRKVFGALGGAVKSAVVGVGGAVGDAASAVGEAGVGAAKAVGEAGVETAKAVGDAGAAAVDTATDAAKAVGQEATDLVKGVGDILGKPFKKDEEKKDE